MAVPRILLVVAVALLGAIGVIPLSGAPGNAFADGEGVVGEAIAVIICPDGTAVEYNPAEVSDPEELCPSVIGEAIAVIVCPGGTAVEYNPAEVSDPEELCPSVIGEAIAVIVCPDGTAVEYNPAEVSDPEELCPSVIGEAIAVIVCLDGTEVEYNPAEVNDPYELCPSLGSGPPAPFECPDGTVVGYAPHETEDPSTLCPSREGRGDEPRREPERRDSAVEIDCNHPDWPRSPEEFLACDRREVPEEHDGTPEDSGKVLLPPNTGTAAFVDSIGGQGLGLGALLLIAVGGGLGAALFVRR